MASPAAHRSKINIHQRCIILAAHLRRSFDIVLHGVRSSVGLCLEECDLPDREASLLGETTLRRQLLALLPAHWRGEETGVIKGAGGPYPLRQNNIYGTPD
jgi:hypothetical protein